MCVVHPEAGGSGPPTRKTTSANGHNVDGDDSKSKEQTSDPTHRKLGIVLVEYSVRVRLNLGSGLQTRRRTVPKLLRKAYTIARSNIQRYVDEQ
jgi:hypothetical protein